MIQWTKYKESFYRDLNSDCRYIFDSYFLLLYGLFKKNIQAKFEFSHKLMFSGWTERQYNKSIKLTCLSVVYMLFSYVHCLQIILPTHKSKYLLRLETCLLSSRNRLIQRVWGKKYLSWKLKMSGYQFSTKEISEIVVWNENKIKIRLTR